MNARPRSVAAVPPSDEPADDPTAWEPYRRPTKTALLRSRSRVSGEDAIYSGRRQGTGTGLLDLRLWQERRRFLTFAFPELRKRFAERRAMMIRNHPAEARRVKKMVLASPPKILYHLAVHFIGVGPRCHTYSRALRAFEHDLRCYAVHLSSLDHVAGLKGLFNEPRPTGIPSG